VRSGERIVNMFAGAGCFSLLIAHYKRATIFSVDKNPYAVECMRRGIAENRLVGRVLPVLGDAARVCSAMGSMDRVLLPLPSIADSFLPMASEMLVPGGTVHLYRESKGLKGECIPNSLKELEELLDAVPHDLCLRGSRIIRSVGCKRWHVVHDLAREA